MDEIIEHLKRALAQARDALHDANEYECKMGAEYNAAQMARRDVEADIRAMEAALSKLEGGE